MMCQCTKYHCSASIGVVHVHTVTCILYRTNRSAAHIATSHARCKHNALVHNHTCRDISTRAAEYTHYLSGPLGISRTVNLNWATNSPAYKQYGSIHTTKELLTQMQKHEQTPHEALTITCTVFATELEVHMPHLLYGMRENSL